MLNIVLTIIHIFPMIVCLYMIFDLIYHKSDLWGMSRTQKKKARRAYSIIKKIYKHKLNKSKLNRVSILSKLWQLENDFYFYVKEEDDWLVVIESRLKTKKTNKEDEKFHDLILDIYKYPGKLIFYLRKSDYKNPLYNGQLYEFFECYRIWLTNKNNKRKSRIKSGKFRNT